MIAGLTSEGTRQMNDITGMIEQLNATHSGIRYRVLNHITSSFTEALVCAFVLSQDTGNHYAIEVVITSESGAIYYAGDEGTSWFQGRTSDVYETINISATVQPGGN